MSWAVPSGAGRLSAQCETAVRDPALGAAHVLCPGPFEASRCSCRCHHDRVLRPFGPRWSSLGLPVGAPASRGGTDPDWAEATAREAGYEPLEAYPGRVRYAWRCRCATCGRQRRPRLRDILRGRRCPHRPPSGP
ncbi:hypothetical protein RKE29_00110 [Streptomyces sp. B1866]|uniref:hypothetical protein n=1 Tax=Streptomyces sp. B1866 TaxID=3075431 RepID=UPI00288C81B7|nr:hypothetical protein [Streptomyces sp. B1866]MDT3395077.1 hypothetical protein [Streptomyces sp. B1866]